MRCLSLLKGMLMSRDRFDGRSNRTGSASPDSETWTQLDDVEDAFEDHGPPAPPTTRPGSPGPAAGAPGTSEPDSVFGLLAMAYLAVSPVMAAIICWVIDKGLVLPPQGLEVRPMVDFLVSQMLAIIVVTFVLIFVIGPVLLALIRTVLEW